MWCFTVYYDPQSVATIYIRIDRQNYEICSLIEQYEMYRNAKAEELVSLKESKRIQKAEFEEAHLNGAIQLAQDIESIVKQAKEETKDQSLNGEVPKDIKNIRENRQKEKGIMKKEQEVDVYQNNSEKELNSVSHDTESVKVLDIFRRKQKEVLHDEDS